MDDATVGAFAQGYAHPVENRARRPRAYGPHDASRVPAALTITCMGRYPVCSGDPSHPKQGRHDVTLPVPDSIRRQQAQLNTTAHDRGRAAAMEDSSSMYGNEKRAGTEDDPKLYLTGHCDPAVPDAHHRTCKDRYLQRRRVPGRGGESQWVDELFLCICDKPCCSDSHELQRRAAAAATVDRAAAVQHLGEHGNATTMSLGEALALQQTQTNDTKPGTSWTADEVADLMVELEACPLCSTAWDAHTFTTDDRVECAA